MIEAVPDRLDGSPRQLRRFWSDEFKATAVEQACQPGVNVSAIARQIGILPFQLYRWRRELSGSDELGQAAATAALNLDAGKPCVLLGAFAGAARDAAIVLGLMPEGQRVERGTQMPSYAEAIANLGGLRDTIPTDLRDQLAVVAGDDGSEPLASAAAAVMADWLQIVAPTAGT
ncbi:transposase [Rhizobium leguminosarum]|uniref:transposase n=1 Tax=Rhizobium leguminosarum TaxID=384 RepID=UPI0021BC0C2F|nr:transposase [Rhizobium leguminosarum]